MGTNRAVTIVVFVVVGHEHCAEREGMHALRKMWMMCVFERQTVCMDHLVLESECQKRGCKW